VSPLSYCLRLIKTRLRSEYELRQGMQQREMPHTEQEAAITQLKEAGLINDLLFARSWIRTRDILAPRGEAVLRLELLQKGIAKSTIEAAFTERREQRDGEDTDRKTEEELGREVIRRKDRFYANLDPETRKRRQISVLQRRGFTYEVIRRILEL
jgi:regulatory protein